MNEISSTIEQKPKVSEMAIASFLIPLVVVSGWLLNSLWIYVVSLKIDDFVIFWNSSLCLLAFILSITLFLFASPVFGVIALINIKKSKGQLRGIFYAITGIILSTSGIVCLVCIRFAHYVLLIEMYYIQ
ncbi:MAG: hypothetical protein ACYSTX_02360 [Planctomycetota bacterium]|jgi:hypothetical protein